MNKIQKKILHQKDKNFFFHLLKKYFKSHYKSLRCAHIEICPHDLAQKWSKYVRFKSSIFWF